MRTVTDKPIYMTAAIGTLLVFESFGLFLFLLSLVVIVRRGGPWGPVVLTSGLCGLVFVWWKSYRLVLDKGFLVYRSPLQWRKRVCLSDLSHITQCNMLKSSGLRPPMRWEVYYRAGGKVREFDINLRVFRFNDVANLEKRLAKWLG